MAAASPSAQTSSPREELDLEIRRLILRIAQLLGYPKSLGEIYGLLYVSPEPLSMDQVRRRLNLSLGSASQGLKALRGLKAVRTVYIPGERKDFYEAETFIRSLIAGFLLDEVQPLLESGKTRVQHLRGLADQLDDPDLQDHYDNRISQIKNLNTAAGKLLPVLGKFLGKSRNFEAGSRKAACHAVVPVGRRREGGIQKSEDGGPRADMARVASPTSNPKP